MADLSAGRPGTPKSALVRQVDTEPAEETVPASAVSLIGQIVSANVQDLAFTTDRIIESLEADVQRLAKTIVEIDQILSNATVIDRATEERLRLMDGAIDAVYHMIERKARK